jgi:hypothetical protein
VRRYAPLLLLVALAVAGCGSADQDSTPTACLNGQKAYTDALAKAPGAVRLHGEVPISDCLVSNQSGGDLIRVGGTLLVLASKLNAQAQKDPGGTPTIELGYLVGAVTRGAEDTQGIHAEMVRRIEAAALYSPAGKPPPEPFDHTYEKGYAAGKDDG